MRKIIDDVYYSFFDVLWELCEVGFVIVKYTLYIVLWLLLPIWVIPYKLLTKRGKKR